MRIFNEDTQSIYDRGSAVAPWLFYDIVSPSTEKCFLDAPLLSLYWDVSGAVLYVKKAQTGAAADWQPLVVAGVTITGDVQITGTLTAGDVTVSA